MKKYFIVPFLFFAAVAFAQTSAEGDSAQDTAKTIFDKKTMIGFTFNNQFSNIAGKNQPADYFMKPSAGGGFVLDYFFSKTLGICTGIGYQQNGAGIRTPDLNGDLGNADSTYRARLRFHSLELPIMLRLRSSKEIFNDARLSYSLGAVPSYTLKTGYIFHSVEDGFHLLENMSKSYLKADLALRAGVGLDFNAAQSCIFRVNLMGNYGFNNVYKDTALFGNAKGRAYSVGIRLEWLF